MDIVGTELPRGWLLLLLAPSDEILMLDLNKNTDHTTTFHNKVQLHLMHRLLHHIKIYKSDIQNKLGGLCELRSSGKGIT